MKKKTVKVGNSCFCHNRDGRDVLNYRHMIPYNLGTDLYQRNQFDPSPFNRFEILSTKYQLEEIPLNLY